MKGVILAGGNGTRLLPLTRVTNKNLLPVGRKPMIQHVVEKLRDADIKEIIIITGTEHMGAVVNLLGSGKEFDCQFTYRVQDQAGGIAQALGLCENFVGKERSCVILGDNIFSAPLKDFKVAVEAQDQLLKTSFGATILLKRVPDPQRFGVAEIDDQGQIVSIVEKPKEPKGDYAVTGIYFYDMGVFSIIKGLKPSGRGELEITDVNNEYLKRQQLSWLELAGDWTDAGTFESLQKANEIMKNV